MKNILIIKTGAIGDVVRTTSLLNVLRDNIYWLTADECKPIFPETGLMILSPNDDLSVLKGTRFDLVLSLEEDPNCAALATDIDKKELIGVYGTDSGLSYTDDSAHWFDMSRVSRLGMVKANELKAANNRSYQDHIFQMIGEKFKGEPYKIYQDGTILQEDNLVGLETRSGRQWPNKRWWGYDQLAAKLRASGQAVRVFDQQGNIRSYLAAIARCSHVVSGDTLAMHLAIAYGKPCTAIFNCTSPQEIYDYGLLKKVVSPLLSGYFYATSFDEEVVNSVTLDEVYNTIPVRASI